MFDPFLTDVTFHLRERDDSIGGDNPFVWVRKNLSELIGGKRVVIFGLPGAFTPTCSNEQLPSYEHMYQEFMDLGIDEIYCTSVNDAFSMFQWAEKLGIKNIKMLPDGNGDFALSLGMSVSKRNLGFGERSWRYSMVVNDMVVTNFLPEDGCMDDCPLDPYSVSSPENLVDVLRNSCLN
jgi:peroxiredoxin